MNVFRVFPNKKNLSTVVKSKGLFLYTKDKKKILDFTSGGTCHAILGWRNKRVENAIKKQLNKFSHVDYKIWKDENTEKLANLLVKNAGHKLDKVYFCGNSGAEACEAAMKMSFQIHQESGRKNKNWFISHKQSYHGSTTDALSLSERPNLEFYRKLQPKNRSLIEMHHPFKLKKENESMDEYAKRSANYLEREILRIGPEKVCAYVGETIMGGLIGDVPPAPNYWKYIKKICEKYKVHLILDEVYCGTGTTGKIYCCDWDDVKPDFIFIGKTLGAGYGAVSAVITKKEYEKIIAKNSGRLQHSTTYQAHSLGIAAALEVQKIIHNQKFLKNVQKLGNFMREVLYEELKKHEFFVNVRGRGLRFSLEYNCKNKNQFGIEVAENILKKYNIFCSVKWHRANFTPSLTLKKKQAVLLLDAFINEFKKTAKKYT